jgi:hypothetical protein
MVTRLFPQDGDKFVICGMPGGINLLDTFQGRPLTAGNVRKSIPAAFTNTSSFTAGAT